MILSLYNDIFVIINSTKLLPFTGLFKEYVFEHLGNYREIMGFQRR